MRKGRFHVGGSYSWKFACEVCGFVYPRAEILKRWDGLNVCKFDWEPRQPLDFFRTIPDAHPLDITNRDQTNSSVVDASQPNAVGWAPGWTNLTLSTLATSPNGDYKDDNIAAVPFRQLSAKILIPFGETVTFSNAGTTFTITLPSAPSAAGTYNIHTNQGRNLASGSIPAGSATLTVTSAAVTLKGFDSITFSGKYVI